MLMGARRGKNHLTFVRVSIILWLLDMEMNGGDDDGTHSGLHPDT